MSDAEGQRPYPGAIFLSESPNVSPNQKTPLFNAPDAVKWICGITILAHLARVFLKREESLALLIDLAFISVRYSRAFFESVGLQWQTVASPITYVLVHGDFTHLLVNVLMFLAFGSAVGRRMGKCQLVLFYIFSGIAGAALFALLNANSFAPLIGASGAVAGMVGAVCFYSLAPSYSSNPTPFRSRNSTFGFIAMWFFLNFFLGALPPEFIGLKGGAIAWETHLGGFIFGLITAKSFDGRGLPPRSFEISASTHT